MKAPNKSLFLSRRHFLQTSLTGASMLASPGLNALLPVPQRKRVIFVFTPHGAPYEEWRPDSCGEAFTLRKASAPLEPVKQHCVFFRGFRITNAGLGITNKVLGGTFSGYGQTTLDIRLGELLKNNVRIPSLHLGASVFQRDNMSKKDNVPVPFASSAAQQYKTLFGETYAADGGATWLDKKLLAHSSDVAADFDTEVDLQIALSALALSRDTTNVISLMWSDTQGDFSLPANYSTRYGDIDFYQAVAGFASNEPYVYFRAYLSMKLAQLIQLLVHMRDSDGLSLLDSTLVVHVTDQGDGRTHEGFNAPYFLAGAKHYFRNGLVLDVSDIDQYDLMDTLGAALGLTDTQYGNQLIRGLLL